MSKQPRDWKYAPEPPISYVNQLRDLGFIMARVLYNRGIETPEKARQFLLGESVLHDPFQMLGMQEAVSRIRQAICDGESIVVYGDFDADGVTSTALMVQTMQALGADVEPYIPDRIDEGYGLNTPALERFASEGTKLVITVDCGIRSIEEVEAANAVGLDIIVTDHHSVGEKLPPALAVLNPKQEHCPYPEKMLAGVGIAFKLASALLQDAHEKAWAVSNLAPEDLLDLVAIGTVADLAPLNHPENRSLVLQGLAALRKAQRPGIHQLMEISKVPPEKVNATSIGYSLGPRINAAGRLQNAMIAYELLMTRDVRQANEKAKELQSINESRQAYTIEAYQRARDMAMPNGNTPPNLIFAADEDFRPGIVGLVAGRLTEEFYRPSVIVQKGEVESHGSCRSIPELNITEALDICADLLIRHGGHAPAAGFTIHNSNLPAFEERLRSIVDKTLADRDLRRSLKIDATVNLIDLNMDLAEKIRNLEPIGTENPEPIFAIRHLRVVEAKQVGKDGNHLKLVLADGPNRIDAIAFGFGDWRDKFKLNDYIDVACHLQINEWNNRLNVQINVIDINLDKH